MHPRPFRRLERHLPPLVAIVAMALFWAIGSQPLRAAGAEDEPARVATVKTLDGPATVERGGRTVALAIGMGLQQSDTVVTGKSSTVGLGFEDEALVSLGPNSRLLIDRFQFDRGGASGHDGGEFHTTLSRGRMAVVSGRIAKSRIDAMKVRTPTALLGVRGTEFIVDVGP
jgi:hypothetical protein